MASTSLAPPEPSIPVLPADEIAQLERLGLEYEIQPEAGMVCVVIREYQLPPGYEPTTVDLLLRLPAGFPDVPPDMWWMRPTVTYTATGQQPPQTQLQETILGVQWQRWSRHLAAGQWRPGRDSLKTYLRIIRSDLERNVPAAAA